MVFSVLSFLLTHNLVSGDYVPHETKYTVLATDRVHDDLQLACDDLGDYIGANFPADTYNHQSVMEVCQGGLVSVAVEDKAKEAWFGPDWKKGTQQEVEAQIAADKWFACSGTDAEQCFDFDGYEQVRYKDRNRVCDALLKDHDKDDHRARIYPKSEALADCQKAIDTPTKRFSKTFEDEAHLKPLESFCKMDTLDEICLEAWYDDNSDIAKLRTSCYCQTEHKVTCAFGESTSSCLNKMLQNLNLDATDFSRIELAVADGDNKPYHKRIRDMDELTAQMTERIQMKRDKWLEDGKLHRAGDPYDYE